MLVTLVSFFVGIRNQRLKGRGFSSVDPSPALQAQEPKFNLRYQKQKIKNHSAVVNLLTTIYMFMSSANIRGANNFTNCSVQKVTNCTTAKVIISTPIKGDKRLDGN